MRDSWELILLAIVAAFALSGWILAEFELRDAHRDLAENEYDLAIALGWQETQLPPIHTALHLIEGGES